MTLQLYILRQLLVSVGFAAGGIALLVFPTMAVQAILKLQGVSPITILRYLPLVMVEFVPYLLPMSFLLGVVATFGRIAADRELVAVRMAGIHPGRLLLPGMAVASALSIATLWLLSHVSPEWKFVQTSYMSEAKETAFRSIGRGTTELDFDQFYLKAERQDAGKDRVFYDVILNLRTEEDDVRVVADRVELSFDDEYLHIAFDGFNLQQGDVEFYNSEPRLSLRLDELFPRKEKSRYRASHLTTPEIKKELASGQLPDERARDFVYEMNRRRALATTYFIFLLLGLPTGIFLRSGTQLGAFTGAVGYAFLYYVMDMRLGEWLAEIGAISAGGGAWSTNALFGIAGIALTYRALWR